MSAENTNTGTPPAAVNPPAENPPAAVTPPASDWTTGLNDDDKGYVQNKGFKDTGALLGSYRNLEKLVGTPQERVLKLPEKEDAPEWNDIYGKLGRPEKPENYKIPVPAGDDGAFSKEAAKWFHEAGISQKQAEKIASKWNEHAATLGAKGAQDAEAKSLQAKADAADIKKEWGAAYEQNLNIVDAAAAKFGMDEKQITALKDSMGLKGALQFLYNIGSKLGEGEFITGNGGPGGFGGALSPVAAEQKIKTLMADPEFSKRYLNGEADAREEMKRLHEMAFPAVR